MSSTIVREESINIVGNWQMPVLCDLNESNITGGIKGFSE